MNRVVRRKEFSLRDVAANEWPRTPWPHAVLVTADEHGQGALARVYKKAVATAEAGGRVVMVVQEAPREGDPKSCRAYQSLGGNGVAVDAVLFFPAGTIAFGHAAGWANATESAYANEHPRVGRGGRGPSPPAEMPPTGSAPPSQPADEPSRRQSPPLCVEEGRRGQDGGHRGATAACIRGGW